MMNMILNWLNEIYSKWKSRHSWSVVTLWGLAIVQCLKSHLLITADVRLMPNGVVMRLSSKYHGKDIFSDSDLDEVI